MFHVEHGESVRTFRSGGDRGLVHVHQGRTDVFTKSDGLSGDMICSLFEDREGDVWVATTTLDNSQSRKRITFNPPKAGKFPLQEAQP